MYLLYKAWYDSLENDFNRAFGYKLIGYVDDPNSVENLLSSFIDPKTSPWPLMYVRDGGDVQKYKLTKVEKYVN